MLSCIVTVSLLIFSSGLLFAEEVKSRDSGVRTQASLVQTIIDKIPERGLRNGLIEYVKIVDPSSYSDFDSVRQENPGIKGYFEKKFETNPCFQYAALGFYDDVAKVLKKDHTCGKGVEFSSAAEKYGCYEGHLSLDDYAGRDHKSKLEEGWLLKLAMKHANNNLPAALDLIGMCGHDDQEQGRFSFHDKSERGMRELKKEIAKHKEMLAEAEREVKKAAKDPKYNKEALVGYKNQLRSLPYGIKSMEESDGNIGILSCPYEFTDFFLPGSLSKQANISPQLVEKIKSIQGRDKKTILPPKHYNIYASANLGCKMAQQGMTPFDANLIQTTSVRLYRGIRMCETVQQLLSKKEAAKTIFRDYVERDNVEKEILRLWELNKKGNLNCDRIQDDKNQGKLFNQQSYAQCEALYFYDITHLAESEREAVVRKVKRLRARIDAATLYSNWYIGGNTVAGVQVPCTDLRLKGPSDLMEPTKGILGKLSRPKDWSNERYEEATRTLATWELDFEWTVAQHSAGVKFGSKACLDYPRKANPFEKAECKPSVVPSTETKSVPASSKKNVK